MERRTVMEQFLLKQNKILLPFSVQNILFLVPLCLPLSSIASETLQGTAEREVSFISLPCTPCPDGGWQRWLMLSPHLWILWEGQCLQHSAAGNWTKEACVRVESPCPITEDSSDPFIFLSFCDMFRKSFAHAVHSFWAIFSFLGANKESAFRFW